MTPRDTAFSLQQIGTIAVRFPSGAPVPSMTDAAVDPYYRTRTPKDVHVEGVLFWPQEKGTYPGIVLLHERWGLTDQIKSVATRLACAGYMVLVPNLYGRQGGMVTANAEVADALASRMKETDVLQDINSCCEFLNSRDQLKRNVHAVVGFGVGAALAVRFACQRKRLRAAVAFYGSLAIPAAILDELRCPVLYHRAGADPSVTDDHVAALRHLHDAGKPILIKTYPDAPASFFDETRDTYRKEMAEAAWESTVVFLDESFRADR